MDKKKTLELERISKSFYGIQVLHSIDMDVLEGEVLGIVGENGAGKSTMMNLIGGILKPDGGSMRLLGDPYMPSGPKAAQKSGIAFVHQELNLFTNLSVAENIFIEDYPTTKLGTIHRKKIREETRRLMEEWDMDIDPEVIVDKLPMGSRQMIEIVKGIRKNVKILVLDEPTTSLSVKEKEQLFLIIQRLKKQGVSILFISHILEDVMSLCDRIAVLRDGCIISVKAASDETKEDMIRQMVGRELKQIFPTITKQVKENVVYELKEISSGNKVKRVSLKLCEGEIVGIYGLMGAGRTELCRAAFGLDSCDGGEVIIHGTRLTKLSPIANIEQGVAFVTEDRHEEGLLMSKSVFENLSLAHISEISKKAGIIDERQEEEDAFKAIEDLQIKVTDSRHQTAGSLSGGNQQKVVFGKWLLRKPEIFLLDEPTKGVDVGAKFEIYTIIGNMAAEGGSILVISSEMEELMGICDRILVMRDGEITGEVNKNEFSQDALGQLAL